MPTALPPGIGGEAPSPCLRLDAAKHAFEGQFVQAALARAGGQRTRAAEELGVTRQGLTKILARHQLAGAVR
jgi:DNA-binding NtrC family response regulator